MVTENLQFRMRVTRLVIAAIVIALVLWVSHVEFEALPDNSKTRDCQEDQACWDCRTMGNRICGP
jgi:hypothetical protein